MLGKVIVTLSHSPFHIILVGFMIWFLRAGKIKFHKLIAKKDAKEANEGIRPGKSKFSKRNYTAMQIRAWGEEDSLSVHCALARANVAP